MIEAPIPSAKEHVVKVGCPATKQWAWMLVLRVDHVVLESSSVDSGYSALPRFGP